MPGACIRRDLLPPWTCHPCLSRLAQGNQEVAVARAVETDPYMNFRFGLRTSRDSDWIGFSAIGINPTEPGSGAGKLELEKAWGEEFLALLNLGKTNLNIGIWHITEDFAGHKDEPSCQIDLHDVDFRRALMSQIWLDAMGQQKRENRGLKVEHPQWTSVMLGKLTVPYGRADFHVKETSFKGRTNGAVAKTNRPIVM